jgi:selenocysteine-specific elongation factor
MGGDSVNDLPNHNEVLNVNVGVLGHVDSGKTSLVKTLSTMLSTAALDKSKESKQRGMTLDLGFR